MFIMHTIIYNALQNIYILFAVNIQYCPGWSYHLFSTSNVNTMPRILQNIMPPLGVKSNVRLQRNRPIHEGWKTKMELILEGIKQNHEVQLAS